MPESAPSLEALIANALSHYMDTCEPPEDGSETEIPQMARAVREALEATGTIVSDAYPDAPAVLVIPLGLVPGSPQDTPDA